MVFLNSNLFLLKNLTEGCFNENQLSYGDFIDDTSLDEQFCCLEVNGKAITPAKVNKGLYEVIDLISGE